MDKVLCTVEQFMLMVENNEGMELEASFWVSMDDLYKIAAQERLEVEDTGAFILADKWAVWYPIKDNRKLYVSFYANN